MRRLRQKLDEYYAQEGAELPFRLRFERNTYRPYVEKNVPPAVELTPTPVDLAPPQQTTNRFWTGVAFGAGSVALVVLVVALIWSAVSASTSRAPREVAESRSGVDFAAVACR